MGNLEAFFWNPINVFLKDAQVMWVKNIVYGSDPAIVIRVTHVGGGSFCTSVLQTNQDNELCTKLLEFHTHGKDDQ